MPKTLCKYFGECGGCSLQHLEKSEYENFKHNILLKVITRLGCDKNIVQNLVKIGERSRRRVEFKSSVNKGKVSFGFYESKSHNVVDIDDCPVTEESITSLIPNIRSLITSLKKPGNIKAVNISSIHKGLDICLVTKSPTAAQDKEKILDYCHKNTEILRIAEKIDQQDPKIIHQNGNAAIKFDEILVELPLQPFLQATVKGQEAITNIILENTSNHYKIADLYCGCGTYSIPLAKRNHIVSAYEGSYEMITSLNNAIRQNDLEDNISAQTRDLIKSPLNSSELKKFDAIVINPPRNGASPQVKQIAKSGVKKVIMVSCNPSTFERDAKYLLNEGYIISSATPIDQFYQTNHLELVAVFDL